MTAERGMDGRVCLVTGANSGIGKETALGLASLGAEVVVVCRSRERGEKAVKEIRDRSGNSSVTLMLADLLSQRSTRGLAAEVSGSHQRIHVLVNNAGSYFSGRVLTEEGVESTFALNHLAPFLLTNLLLDRLRSGAPSRIVTVASVSHYGARIDFEDIRGVKGRYDGLRAYGRSKLANVLFTYELARRLEGTGVTANCLHPGAVRTNIWRHSGVFAPLVMLGSLFMASPKKGAETTVYLASSPEVEGVSGRYFTKRREVRSSGASYDGSAALRLWDASAELTGLA